VILGSHASIAENSIVLRCETVLLGKWYLTFQRQYDYLKHQNYLPDTTSRHRRLAS